METSIYSYTGTDQFDVDYNRIVFFDPGECKTFTNDMINELENKGYEIKKSKNLLTFKNNKVTIEYYTNTSMNNALMNPETKKKLNEVLWKDVKIFIRNCTYLLIVIILTGLAVFCY